MALAKVTSLLKVTAHPPSPPHLRTQGNAEGTLSASCCSKPSRGFTAGQREPRLPPSHPGAPRGTRTRQTLADRPHVLLRMVLEGQCLPSSRGESSRAWDPPLAAASPPTCGCPPAPASSAPGAVTRLTTARPAHSSSRTPWPGSPPGHVLFNQEGFISVHLPRVRLATMPQHKPTVPKSMGPSMSEGSKGWRSCRCH